MSMDYCESLLGLSMYFHTGIMTKQSLFTDSAILQWMSS